MAPACFAVADPGQQPLPGRRVAGQLPLLARTTAPVDDLLPGSAANRPSARCCSMVSIWAGMRHAGAAREPQVPPQAEEAMPVLMGRIPSSIRMRRTGRRSLIAPAVPRPRWHGS